MATKKRHPKHRALAKVIGARLEELRRDADPERPLNYSEFAARAGVPRSVYNAWRNSGRVPGGAYLRVVAEAFGVTADWLLGFPDAPKYRRQVRTSAELASDVAVHVARELKVVARGTEWEGELEEVRVDGAAFLSAGVERESARIGRAWKARYRWLEGALQARQMFLGLHPTPMPDTGLRYWREARVAVLEYLEGDGPQVMEPVFRVPARFQEVNE